MRRQSHVAKVSITTARNRTSMSSLVRLEVGALGVDLVAVGEVAPVRPLLRVLRVRSRARGRRRGRHGRRRDGRRHAVGAADGAHRRVRGRRAQPLARHRPATAAPTPGFRGAGVHVDGRQRDESGHRSAARRGAPRRHPDQGAPRRYSATRRYPDDAGAAAARLGRRRRRDAARRRGVRQDLEGEQVGGGCRSGRPPNLQGGRRSPGEEGRRGADGRGGRAVAHGVMSGRVMVVIEALLKEERRAEGGLALLEAEDGGRPLLLPLGGRGRVGGQVPEVEVVEREPVLGVGVVLVGGVGAGLAVLGEGRRGGRPPVEVQEEGVVLEAVPGSRSRGPEVHLRVGLFQCPTRRRPCCAGRGRALQGSPRLVLEVLIHLVASLKREDMSV